MSHRIPIIRMGEFLLVSIQVDMHDQLALQLQDDLTTRIQKLGSKGVLIDISALDMVDSFIGRMISDISGMARILGARSVLVGMQPAVAITLVELGTVAAGRGDRALGGTRHEAAADRRHGDVWMTSSKRRSDPSTTSWSRDSSRVARHRRPASR